MADMRPTTAPSAPFDLKSITSDPIKMGKYTPRNREQTFAMEYKTSYTSMCQHLEGHRSPIPPGYTGHQPGTLFKFGFGNPGTERPATVPAPEAFADARRNEAPLPGEILSSSAHCRVPFDSLRISTANSARESKRQTGSMPWKRNSLMSPRESQSPSRTFFRAEPPTAPPPTVAYVADEFPEEVKPVRYMEKKGRPVHFWPYYRPLGGQHLTPSPGAQHPPHPPDTVEKRDMKSTYTNALIKNVKKVFGKTSEELSTRGATSLGGYEKNFTPLQAAWQGDDGGIDGRKKDFSTSYNGSFTRAAVTPRRRNRRLGA